MPSPMRSLDAGTARDLIRERAFPEVTGERVGLELEWLTIARDGSRPTTDELSAIVAPLAPLPHGSRITFEPGGQVEVSTPPVDHIQDACRRAAADGELVRRTLAGAGIDCIGLGMDAARAPTLLTTEPRYRAMRAYFDAHGLDGGRMMCSTASLHVNVDAGSDDEGRRRWHLANALGPMLLAAFAHSPLHDGAPTGWKSTRMATWYRVDPSRSSPVLTADGEDASEAWASYAMDARVMFIRASDGFVTPSDAVTFAEWVEHGHKLGHPTADDLAYHLTTLFPPVVPRGWLELRMIDMVPDPWWHVAAAVTHTALTDPDVAPVAGAAAKGSALLWREAAQDGLEHPRLRETADAVFRATIDRLDGPGRAVVAEYHDRYVLRGRCPADDRIDAWTSDGSMHPSPMEVSWEPSTT